MRLPGEQTSTLPGNPVLLPVLARPGLGKQPIAARKRSQAGDECGREARPYLWLGLGTACPKQTWNCLPAAFPPSLPPTIPASVRQPQLQLCSYSSSCAPTAPAVLCPSPLSLSYNSWGSPKCPSAFSPWMSKLLLPALLPCWKALPISAPGLGWGARGMWEGREPVTIGQDTAM